MKRFTLFFFFFLASFCFGDGNSVPSTGNESVDELFNSLYSQLATISGSSSSLLRQNDIYYQGAVATLDGWQNSNTGSSDSYDSGYNAGRVDAGSTLLINYLKPAHDQVRNVCIALNNDVDICQSKVVQLAMRFSEGSYDDILAAISNNTFVISTTVSTNMLVCISNVQEIVSLLKSVFPSSSPDSNLPDELNDLDSSVQSLVIDFAVFWQTVDSVFTWFNDVDEDFRKFYETARSRLTAPDPTLASALRDMWEDTLHHRADIIGSALTNLISYTIDDQVEVVLQQISQDFRLSNEGQIALDNLAVNTRSYLVLQELLNKTNSVDLSWFTNYFGNVQSKFYEQFNHLIYPDFPVSSFNPYVNTVYSVFTNFADTAISLDRSPGLAYQRWVWQNTNVFSRLETLLLYQNGLIGPKIDPFGDDQQAEDQFNYNLDRENIERHIRYSTNSVVALAHNVSTISNNFLQLVTSFKNCLSAFEMPPGESDGVIRLTPNFDLGELSIPAFYLNMSDIKDVTDTCHIIFQVIWYLLFSFISFKFVVFTFLAFSKSLKFFASIFSRLMS